MGILKHLGSGREVVLASHFIAGRAPLSGVLLEKAQASTVHASLSWVDDHWEVRDHGSRNHTAVGDVEVPPPASKRLKRGDVIRFGCDDERWALIDEGAPVAAARRLSDGERRVAENGLLALPDADNVLLSIVLGAGDRWMAESLDGTRREVSNGEQVQLADQGWELLVPPAATVVAGTQNATDVPSIVTVRLRLRVSLNEDHVHVELLLGPRVIELGEKASFYLLYVLAKERLADAAKEPKLPESEQGWYDIPTLCADLATDERALNVTVFRLREAFAKAKMEGAEGMVERRLRQMRIGIDRVEIIRATTADSLPAPSPRRRAGS
jgi:hypothetical protein